MSIRRLGMLLGIVIVITGIGYLILSHPEPARATNLSLIPLSGMVLSSTFTGASSPPAGYSGGATANAPYLYNDTTGAILMDELSLFRQR